MYDLIVIGSGPGGYEAAAHAGRMKKKVLLLEKGPIGGTCLNVGCIPTKTFLRTAQIFKECREASKYGVTTSAPKISLPALQKRKSKVVATLQKGVEGLLKAGKVEVVKAQAELVSAAKVKAGKKKYEAKNILIATGSVPAVPPVPGMDKKGCLDSTGVLKLTTKPRSIVIIGGGIIGLEFACFFNEIGTRVTVIEMLPEIALGIDKDMAKRLRQTMEEKGVVFHLSSPVTKIEKKKVSFKPAEGKARQVSGEVVLNATGRRPVTENLGLEAAGVDVTRQGIRADALGKTNVPGVWACGDVTGRCLLAHAATREGIVAVNNMFGVKDRIRYHAIPSVVYTHPEVASAGRTEEQLKAEQIQYHKSMVPMAVAGRFTVEHEGESGYVKVLAGAQYGEILGVHMLGDPGGEIIHSAAAMIEREMRVTEIKDVIFPHPTVSEALKEAITRLE